MPNLKSQIINLKSQTDNSYPIYFSDSFDALAEKIAPFVKDKICAIVSNPVVWPLYGKEVATAIKNAGGNPVKTLLPDGEEHKNFSELEKLLEKFVENNLNRKSIVVALGGGVVGDLAGYAAASYMRGIPYIQIPTTLLAQVDSSVGGKTGVNLSLGKNLVGAFYQPKLVYINWNTLSTLLAREVRAGYAEVIKYGVISDADLFKLLEKQTAEVFKSFESSSLVVPGILGEIIKRCCKIKTEVVAEDEREHGLRAILNYGHTFAHAIEKLTNYTEFVHGEAVAIGMNAAAVYANKLGMCEADVINRQKMLIESAGLPTQFPKLETEEVIAEFYHDKKATASELKFILPAKIGKVKIIKNPDLAALKETITDCETE